MSILINAPQFDKLGVQADPPVIGYSSPVEVVVSVWTTDGSTTISQLNLKVSAQPTGQVQEDAWRVAIATRPDMSDKEIGSKNITFDSFSGLVHKSVYVLLVQGISRTQGSYTLTLTPTSYTALTHDAYTRGATATGAISP
ncbi:hypothetical protein [Sorangium sp. So ce385]|uniref:hypothetical protein n=1 Tax=Sorangium sp. So ce385 TaxID=3133308 RepID=UPI003F5C4030